MSNVTYEANPAHLLFPLMLMFLAAVLLTYSSILAAALFVISIVASIWMLIAGLYQVRIAYNYSIVAIAEQVKSMDPERYRALGIAIPELRVYPSVEGPVLLMEDTEIRLDSFVQFMNDSDEYQFAPQRLYGDGTLMRRQWFMAVNWLVKRGHLIESSASGSHTYLWRSGRRTQVMREYLNKIPEPLPNLNDEEELRA